MPHVVVAGPIHAAGLAILAEAEGFSFEIADAAYAGRLHAADALLIRTQPLPAAMIAQAERLKVVARHGVGFDAVDVGALSARGIPLVIIGDVNARPVAEHTLALLLALAKRIPAYDHATRAGDWALRNSFSAVELWDKSLLLIGFGRIGRIVAGMARAFGMKIMAYDPFQTPQDIRLGGAEAVASLDEGLKAADFVSLHMPRSGEAALIGAEHLRLMRPGAFLINTARGGLIDETAVVEALDAGHLAGLATDVFVAEPPAPTLALLRHARTIVSPHSAALTAECAVRMSEMSAQNILDYFAGRLDPALVVNRADL